MSAVLKSAKPDTTIVLSPGIYVEPNGLDCNTEGISILGCENVDSNGQPMSEILGYIANLHERHFFQISATKFLMRNVKIEVLFSSSAEKREASDQTACVSILNKSQAVFEYCDVLSQKNLVGFSVQHHSKPWIKFCTIANNKW